MYELSVIKVINPSCFFCTIVGLKDDEEYEQLFLELNMLYGHKYRDVEELRPASLSIEQLCMVFCVELKSWCRAVLESDTCSAKDELVECFLLDHAVFTPIKKSDIRFPIEEYYRLPFRAKKFKLHQIQPISLGFNVYENKMDFRPRKDWDLAAVSFFHQLLEDAIKIKADFCSVEDDYISVFLYIITKDSVLCVNDELVAKKFASYYKDNSVYDEVNGNAIIPMVNGIQSPGQENGPGVKELQSPGHQNVPMVKELQSHVHQNGSMVKELQSPGHQNVPMVKELQSHVHQNGSMAKELQSHVHQNGSMAKELQSPGHQNGSMAKEQQSPGHQNAPRVKELQSHLHQNGSLVKELQSPGHQNGSMVKELQSPGHQNGSIIKELQSPVHKNTPRVIELQLPRHQNTPILKDIQSPGHQNGSMVKELQSPGHQNGSMVKELQSPGHQNGSMVKELQSPGHQNGVKSVSLSKEEAQVPKKASPKIASQPILWSAWRCLDGGHTTDIQQESRSVLHKDKPPFLANQSRKPSDFVSKDSTTQSLRSQNGSSPVLLQRDEPPPSDDRHGNVSLSLDTQNQTSNIQEKKIETGPEAVTPSTPSTWNNTEGGPKLFQDVPERAAAEIRGHSEEKTCLPVLEAQDPLAMPTTEAFSVVQSPWPALCNVDRARRMSTEIQEESIARIRTPSGNVSSSAPDNMSQAQRFTKLLHFLNPNPAQLSEEENDEPKAVGKLQEAVFVSKTLTAYHTLESALLFSGIKKRLMATGYSGPNLTESYCWAPIAEGSDTIVITPDCTNPMYYIPPLLTYLNCASAIYKVLPAKHGPHAIVLCSSWDKCHTVYNLLMDYSKCVQLVNPTLLLVGQSKEEIEGLNLRKPCCLVVTTPHCLLRCMEHHGLLLLRLCHLVLDEVGVLFAKARSQMSAILEAYKKTASAETRDDTSQQVVAIGNAWHQDMELLLNYTSCPQVIITRMKQAAVFANVQQILHLCLDCEKMSVLLQCLDFTPVNTQKILIFTSSDEEAELVHKVVQTGPTYNLMLNRKEVYNFTYILEQWKKVFSRGTVLVLVVTDDYAPILDITDATCIIHYSFPQNTDVLNKRLFSLLDYIQSKMDKVTRQEQDCFRAKSILLMTDKHARHAVDVLNSLKQAQATIPVELVDLTEGILKAKEELKSNEELCPHLKRLGYCIRDTFSCPNRHHINPMTDLHRRMGPVVEADQNITVLPLCIVDASCFYGRIVTNDDPYEKLAKQLDEYYHSAENKVPAGKVETNQLCALCNVSAYHRVLVLQTRIVASVFYVTVKYIDEGGTDFIPGHMLLKLPLVFQSLPPQYLEFIICRVKPIDTEVKWDSKVTRIINRSIRGKRHRAKVVLNLGKTYWLDPMVQISSLTGLSTVVYDLNVRQEIFATGMATDNPEHVTHLKALLNSATTPLTASVRSSSDECLTRSKRVLGSIPEEPRATSPEEPRATSPEEPRATSPEPRATSPEPRATSPEPQVTSPLPPAQEKEPDKQEDKPKDLPPIQNPPSMSFHPVVKWYEKGDMVFLAVKLQEIRDHKCTFYPTRVLFSCHAEGKHYKADFDLCNETVAEKSRCSVNSGEALISLEKKNHESWARLLTQKNPYVTYDYDQLEDSEESNSPPAVFQNKQKPMSKSYTVVCESAVSTDYSDTESLSD
ncbi:putative ATP-dependent RNA helicase TDRD12 [Rana temporaria]|uniref:putative ATP-dependent RNA helicase TDRD12 n=1 Tax=Rana temporaria TaxID=8407 RepID=UPI001AAD9208|nr:putative ATP-dependent RNA helicase TDRD12 [Rana temporaria]